MKKFLISCCMVITLGMTLTTDNSQATKLLVDDEGMLLGAKHVLVDELFYNVTFEYGSFLDLYVWADGTVNNLFDFYTSRHAAQALLDQVLIDKGKYMFDSNPGRITGNTPTNNCAYIYTPVFLYEGEGEYVYTWTTRNYTPELEADSWRDRVSFDGTMVDDNQIWAVWEKSSPVPEPTTFLLFGSGLFGIIGTRLRRKNSNIPSIRNTKAESKMILPFLVAVHRARLT